MTPEEALKIEAEIRAQRYDPRHYTTEFAAQQACMALAAALREAQAQTVQMRTEALLKLRALGNDPHLDGDARFEAGVMATIVRAQKAIGSLPGPAAPAARTYDDGVREPIAEVRHACGRAYLSIADVAVAMEGDPMRDADLPEEAYEPIPADELDGATIGGKSVKGMDIRVVRSFRRDVWSTRTMKYVAKRINDAALLSPAPAVAPVAAPKPGPTNVSVEIERLAARVAALESRLAAEEKA